MKLPKQQVQSLIKALTHHEARALSDYFSAQKREIALHFVTRDTISEYERGKVSGMIACFDLFISESRIAQQIVDDEIENETLKKMSQDKTMSDIDIDIEAVLNKANSLKS